MGWAVRVISDPTGAESLRVQIATRGEPKDGWMAPSELVRTLPPAPDDRLEALPPAPVVTAPREEGRRWPANPNRLDDVRVEQRELAPDNDLVLELEEDDQMGNPLAIKQEDVDRRVAERKAAERAAAAPPTRGCITGTPAPKPCTEPGCKGTYVPIGRRSKCDDCRYPGDKAPVAKREKIPPPVQDTRPDRALVAKPRPASPKPASSNGRAPVLKRAPAPTGGMSCTFRLGSSAVAEAIEQKLREQVPTIAVLDVQVGDDGTFVVECELRGAA